MAVGPNVNSSLKDTVKDASALAEAMTHLSTIAEAFFGKFTQGSNMMGANLKRTADQAKTGVSASDFATPQGARVFDLASEYAFKDFEKQLFSTPGVVTDTHIEIEGGIDIGGQKVRKFAKSESERKRQFLALRQQNRENIEQTESPISPISDLSAKIRESAAFALSRSSLDKNHFGAGVGVKDFFGINEKAASFSAGGDVGQQIVRELQRLRESSVEGDKVQANMLEKLHKDLAIHQKDLSMAKAEMAAATTDQAKAQAYQRVMNATGAMQGTMKETEDFLAKSGGGGGGGRGAGLRGMMGRIGPLASGIFSAGMAGYEAYGQASGAFESALYNKELQAHVSTGAIAAKRFDDYMGSQDLTNPENILRYYGDRLLPGKTTFLGASGIQNANRVAAEAEAFKVDSQERQRTHGLIGSIGKVAVGVGMIGAGIVSAPTGIGAAIGIGGGAAAIMSGMGGISNYIGNPLTSAENMNQGLTGTLGRFIYGDKPFEKLSSAAQIAALQQKNQQRQSEVQMLQDADVNSNRKTLVALTEIQSMREAQKRSAELVGGFAISTESMMRQYGQYGTRDPDIVKREEVDKLQEAYQPTIAKATKAKEKAQADLTKLTSKPASEKGYIASGLEYITDDASKTKFFEDGTDFGLAQQIGKALYKGVGAVTGLALGFTDYGKAKQKATLEADLQNRREKRTISNSPEQVEAAANHDKYVANYGTDKASADFKRQIEHIESRGDINATNKFSSAFGLYQFTRPTVQALGFDYDKMKATSNDPKEMLRARMYQNQVMDANIKRNTEYIQKHNLAKNPAAIEKGLSEQTLVGLAHFAGPGGVKHYLETGKDKTLIAGFGQSMEKYASALGVPIPLQQANIASGGAWVDKQKAAVQMGGFIKSLQDMELSGAEYMMKNAQVTNALGVGSGTASGKQTMDVIRMGRSGLGSFEQHIGTLQNLKSLTGQSDNIANLKAVLTEAVTAGFNKSHAAQMFVQTTTKLMGAGNLTDAAMTSQHLRNMSNAYGSDERGLAMAEQGAMNATRFTSQKGGMVGALKLMGALSAGIGLKQGAALISTFGDQKTAQVIEELKSSKSDDKLSFEARALIDGSNRQKALSGLMQSQSNLKGVVTSTLGEKFTNFQDRLKAAQSMAPAERKKAVDKVMQELAYTSARNDPMNAAGEGSTLAMASTYFQSQGLLTKGDTAKYNKTVASGNAMWRNVDEVKKRAARDQLLADFVASDKGASGDMYKSFLASGGTAFTVNKGGKDIAVTASNFEEHKDDPEFKKKLGETSKLELIRQSEAAAVGSEKVQFVHIANASEVAMKVATFSALAGGEQKLPTIRQNLSVLTGNGK
jgi:hypothetical protein